jgi:hypothetical protein
MESECAGYCLGAVGRAVWCHIGYGGSGVPIASAMTLLTIQKNRCLQHISNCNYNHTRKQNGCHVQIHK